ncbi:hypothetical protein M426DRAFT_261936 [Hypoxylon sp. CI-4A]|nr:hypothetical protein M426DRAFT_261936 [Hypoxylon sp. CI-4A]
MATQPIQHKFCICQSQCRLCRFPVYPGNIIVVGLDAQWFSPNLPFKRHRIYQDPFMKPTGQPCQLCFCCYSKCPQRTGLVSMYHASCFNFKQYDISLNLLQATDLALPPPLHGKLAKEREARFHNAAFRKLQKDPLVGKLPPEICHMIAGYLIREFAVITTEQQCLDSRSSNITHPIDVYNGLYAQYTLFEGKRYVQTLSTTGGDGKTVLWKGGSEQTIQNIYLAEDALGIRHVECVTGQDISPAKRPRSREVPGVTWRAIVSAGKITAIKPFTDGLKLRDVWNYTPGTEQMPRGRISYCYSTRNMLPLGPVPFGPSRTRLNTVDFNEPGVAGYAAAISKTGILAIHTHYQEVAPDFYSEIDPSLKLWPHWIYMPINKGEYITEICLYSRKNPEHTLVFITNRGRARLATPEDGIGIIMCSDLQNQETRRVPRSICPFRFPTENTILSEFPCTYSSCPLWHVAQITLHGLWFLPHKPIFGMLIRYEDGTEESVGEFRFDLASKPIQVGLSDKICICTSQLDRGHIDHHGNPVKNNYVKAVTTTKPTSQDEGDTWLEVPLKGTLEWWFTRMGMDNDIFVYYRPEDRKTIKAIKSKVELPEITHDE